MTALHSLFNQKANPDWRLRAMWTLQITGGFTKTDLTKSLTDTDPHVRAWAIQFLTEDGQPTADVIVSLTGMARTDPSPVVRLYLASALQRLDYPSRWQVAAGLVAHADDATDHNIPKMIWYGLEPMVAGEPAKALNLSVVSKIPMVSQFLARRLVDADLTDKLVATLGTTPAKQNLLEGMRDALDGRYDMVPPANWKSVYTKLRTSPGPSATIAEEINQHFGDTEAAKKQLATLEDRAASTLLRASALQNLSVRQRPELVKELPALLNEPELRQDAIRALASYDNEALGKLVLERYPTFTPAEKAEAIQTLASRPRYGWLLTQALAKGTLPKKDVPSYAARQLRRVVGSGFVEVWGPIDHVSFDEKAYTKYRALLTENTVATADVRHGKQVFTTTCGPCHTLYGEGGTIGPDITGSNRANLDYLLGNILDPSGEIQDDYKMVVITTRDGRTYVGNVAKETERQLTLRVVGQDAVPINKSDIQSREVTPASMMPTGLFESLSDKEVVNLIGYLRTREAVK